MDKASRFSDLDSLRGFSAVIVVLFHFAVGEPQYMAQGFKFGILGVDLFFVISGFVIFHSISHRSSITRFLKSRFLRLYPVYWACMLITFFSHAWLILKPEELPYYQQLYTNATMLQYYFNIPHVDNVYWTLTVEWLFYLLMVILMSLNLIRFYKVIFTVLIVATLLMTKLFWGDVAAMLLAKLPLLEFLPLFLAGISFYQLKKNGFQAKEMMFICFSYLSLVWLRFDATKIAFENRGSVSLNEFEYGASIFLIFLVFTLLTTGKIRLQNKLFIFLGKISYPLYLIHFYFVIRLMKDYFVMDLGQNWYLSALICLGISVFCASVIHFMIEKPLSVYKRKLLA